MSGYVFPVSFQGSTRNVCPCPALTARLVPQFSEKRDVATSYVAAIVTPSACQLKQEDGTDSAIMHDRARSSSHYRRCMWRTRDMHSQQQKAGKG